MGVRHFSLQKPCSKRVQKLFSKKFLICSQCIKVCGRPQIMLTWKWRRIMDLPPLIYILVGAFVLKMGLMVRKIFDLQWQFFSTKRFVSKVCLCGADILTSCECHCCRYLCWSHYFRKAQDAAANESNMEDSPIELNPPLIVQMPKRESYQANSLTISQNPQQICANVW